MYKVNKDLCVGCGTCTAASPEGVKVGEDGAAQIIDQEKVKESGGASICPFGAIEKVEESEGEESANAEETN